MKRYKLKKDLPTFKAGDEFYLDSNNDLRLKKPDIMAYSHITLEKFPNILKDWFEEIHENKRWRGKYNERYWCVDGRGGVYCPTEDGHSVDDYRFDTGSYFKTEEEAKAYKKYLIARQVILDDAEGGKFSYGEENWCTYYSKYAQEWTGFDNDIYHPGMIYFRTGEALQKSLEEHKEQWQIVRKYEMMGEK